MGGGAEDTTILYSSIPDEVNPAKSPYIGAMMAQGERLPMCQDPAWEQLSVAPLTDMPEPQSHRGSGKIVWKLNNYPSHTVLAFIKKQIGPKVNKITKDHI